MAETKAIRVKTWKNIGISLSRRKEFLRPRKRSNGRADKLNFQIKMK
jgi:hypothetical protein